MFDFTVSSDIHSKDDNKCKNKLNNALYTFKIKFLNIIIFIFRVIFLKKG